jgi:RNA polymerase sigma-70 factor, ECF subfamily
VDSANTQTDFDEFYTKHFQGVFRYSSACAPDDETARDLTSKIFEKVWRAWPPRTNEPLVQKVWLFRAAKHVVFDYRRESKRRPTVSLNNEAIGNRLYSLQEEAIIERIDLQAAIATLPKRDQVILGLRLAGLTNREIASVLDTSEDAAAMAYLRVVKRLGKKLEPKP